MGVIWPEITGGATLVGSGARSMFTQAVQVPDPPVVVTMTSLGPRVEEKSGATFTVALRAVRLMGVTDVAVMPGLEKLTAAPGRKLLPWITKLAMLLFWPRVVGFTEVTMGGEGWVIVRHPVQLSTVGGVPGML